MDVQRFHASQEKCLSQKLSRILELPVVTRKPGRPRKLPKQVQETIIELYNRGYGYRSIAKILLGINIETHWSTVRRLVKEKTDKNCKHKLRYCHYGDKAKHK